MNAGERYRIVTVQDGREYVSTVVLSREEARDSLDMEIVMHRGSGWDVVANEHEDGLPNVYCMKGSRQRQVYARAFSPLEDVGSGPPLPPPAPRTPLEVEMTFSEKIARGTLLVIAVCTGALAVSITAAACIWILRSVL